MTTPSDKPDEPQCTGPNSSAYDCPVHDPRKWAPPVKPQRKALPECGLSEQEPHGPEIEQSHGLDCYGCGLIALRARSTSGTVKPGGFEELFIKSFAREAALEEAAKLCDESQHPAEKDLWQMGVNSACTNLRDRIRALKDTEPVSAIGESSK